MSDYQAGYDAARRDAAKVAHRHLDLALARRIIGDDAGEGSVGGFLQAVAHIRDDILAMPDPQAAEAHP